MYTHDEHVWSTVVSIHIDDLGMTESRCARAVRDVLEFVHDVDRVFSTYRADSMITLLRTGVLTAQQLSDRSREAASFPGTRQAWPREPYMSDEGFSPAAYRDLEIVIRYARYASLVSHGAFDAESAGFDLDGITKGWAAGRALQILRGYGITRAYVNAGGDLALMSDSDPWVIGVSDPEDTSRIVKTVEISNGAVATSGTYERGPHIPDGKLLSVTVVGPDPALADALATALCVSGLDTASWFQELVGYSLYAVTPHSRVAHAYGPAFVPQ